MAFHVVIPDRSILLLKTWAKVLPTSGKTARPSAPKPCHCATQPLLQEIMVPRAGTPSTWISACRRATLS